MRAVLYITEQGSIVKKSGKRILVSKDKEVILDIPVFKINRVLIFGNIHLTPQARDLMLDNGIDIGLLSINGRFRGKFVSSESKNIYLRLAQYDSWYDEEKKAEIACGILSSKMKSQMEVLKIYHQRERDADGILQKIEMIQSCEANLTSQTDIEQIRGLEGMASSVYFSGFSKTVKGDYVFEGRKMHPSTDPVNALLSLTYACLTNELSGLLEAKGFEPFLGFVHGIKYGRKSLALDLVEDYRHAVGDLFVLNLMNYRIIKPDDFVSFSDGGLHLTEDKIKVYFKHWNEWRMQVHFQTANMPDLMKLQLDRFEQTILYDDHYPGLWGGE